MSFPAGITRREVTAGVPFGLTDGSDLIIEAIFKPSRSMVWGPTGFPGIARQIRVTSDPGLQLSVFLPVTDQTGWLDGAGNALSVANGAQTHTYAVTIRFNTPAGVLVEELPVKNIALPAGDLTAIDLDTLIPVSTVSGVTIAIPDTWSAILAAAQSVAAAAGTQSVGGFLSGNLPNPGVNQTALSNAILARTPTYWQPSTSYGVGTMVIAPDGSVVMANTSFTSAATYNGSNWTTVIASAAANALAFLPYWKPNTAYTATSIVVNPSGQTVKAKAAFTSTSSYDATNWDIVSGGTGGSGAVSSVAGRTGAVVLSKTDVGLGNVTNTADADKPVSTATQTALNSKADLVGGLIPSSQLPSLTMVTAVPVASQAAMLALTSTQVQPGDVAVRSDGAGTFMLTGSNPATLANWTLLAAPTDVVSSVAGRNGAVVLAKGDVGLSNVDNTADADKPVSTAQAAAIAARAAVLVTAAVSTATTDTLAVDTVAPVDAGLAAATRTLPTPTKVGQIIVVEKVDSSTNAVTVTGTIRGTASASIALVWQYETIELVAESLTSWRPVAGHKRKTDIDAAIAAAVAGATASSSSAPPVAPLEAAPFTLYGHSYIAGPPVASGDGARFFDRVATRLRTQTATNYGVSGTTIRQIARKVFDTWTAGTSYGLVGLSCTANNLQTATGPIPGELVAPFRLIMATLRSAGRFENTSTALTYNGTWTANTGDSLFSGGTYQQTTTVGDSVDVYCPTDPCYVSVGFGASGNGVITATRSGDSATIGTFDTGTGSAAGPGAIRLAGLGGATTVRLTLTSGTRMQVDCVLPQSSTPPTVVWSQEPQVPANGTTKNTIQEQNTFPAIKSMLDSEFPATVTATAGSSWDQTAMTIADNMHITDSGNSYLAGQIVAAIAAKGLTFAAGQNVAKAALVTASPSAPSYTSSGGGSSSVSLVRQNTAAPAVTSTPTVTLPAVAAGHGVVLTLSDWGPNPKAVNSVSDSAGGTWTRVTSQASANFGQQEMWVCGSHPGSASTLTITLTLAANASTAINVSEWSKSLAVNQSAIVNTTGTAPAATVTSAAGNLVLTTFSAANNALPAATSPAVSLTTVTGASNYCANASAYVAATGASTTIGYAAISSANYGILIASFTAS